MRTMLVLRKATALATLTTFLAIAGFAEPAWAEPSPTPIPRPAAAPAPTPVAAQARLEIDHDPLACVTTMLAPVVEAKVEPGADMARSYVFWRAAGTPYFYYTVMAGAVPEQAGTLPRPLPETNAIDYYVQATDRASLSKKTPEYAPPVVPGNACKMKGLEVGKNGAGLTIGLTDEAQPVIPPGFNKDDIARVILVTGAVVTVAAALAGKGSGSTGTAAGAGAAAGAAAAGASAAGATAGAGGGTAAASASGSSTALIVGGILVAGGVGAGIAISNGNKKTATPQSTATPTPSPTPTATPVPNRFIEVEATWSGTGDVDIQLLNPSGEQVGQVLPAGCESTAARTERVVLQGTNITAGTYQVRLVGKACGAGTPAQITTVLTVTTDSGPKCQSVFVSVPVGQTVAGCGFTEP